MILLIKNTEAAGLTGYIQQLELCCRDIASLPNISINVCSSGYTYIESSQ